MERIGMRWLIGAVVLAAGWVPSNAWAQVVESRGEPTSATVVAGAPEAVDAPIPISLGQLTPTPEMWFYEQARKQYEDPQHMVRRQAEFETQQRMHRMAAMRWYGMSNSRPTAGITPFMSPTYAPAWRSNSRDPYLWTGVGAGAVYVVPRRAAR